MHSIIASGSTENSVVYHNSIMVDCGIPFNQLRKVINNLQLVLLTHKHSDHLNLSTIKKLAFERPSLRFGCCEWMVEHLEGIKNVDVYEIGKLYDYSQFQISPVKLYHDVNNCGYRIFKDGIKIFHATDTCTLDGISAKEYDLYALEHNYDEETVWDNIKAIEDSGGFAHQRGAINSHLSEQQAKEFFFRNMKESSKLIRLHEHHE